MVDFVVGDTVRRKRGTGRQGNLAEGQASEVLHIDLRRDGDASVTLACDAGGPHKHAASSLERVPNGTRKDDAGKLDMTLLDDMPRAVQAVVQVMQWANTAKKPKPYTRGSWLGNPPSSYRAAMLRHTYDAAHQSTRAPYEGPERQLDPESRLPHLAHAACNALMALEITLRELEVNGAAVQE